MLALSAEGAVEGVFGIAATGFGHGLSVNNRGYLQFRSCIPRPDRAARPDPSGSEQTAACGGGWRANPPTPTGVISNSPHAPPPPIAPPAPTLPARSRPRPAAGPSGRP